MLYLSFQTLYYTIIKLYPRFKLFIFYKSIHEILKILPIFTVFIILLLFVLSLSANDIMIA